MMVANTQDKTLSIIENPSIVAIKQRVNEVIAIHQQVFQKGVHYGAPYKGAKSDTLLKPGATFLQQKYALHAQHERMETTIHVDPTDLSKSYIIIQDRCRIFDEHGQEIAQADAACSTFEDKYLFRGGSGKTCPDCGGQVMKSKFPDRKTNDLGWYCRDCKANFVSTDERITGQATGKSFNENPLNLMDTIIAMAQKRAEVRATIKATGVDSLFSPGDGVTMDYYDDVMDDGNAEVVKLLETSAAVTSQNASISQNTVPNSSAAVEDGKTPTEPQNDATTPAEAAKSRFAGNGAKAGEKKTVAPKATNPPAPGWMSDAKITSRVFKAVRELYNSTEHMQRSVMKLQEAGTLTNDMNEELAIQTIRHHKDSSQAPF